MNFYNASWKQVDSLMNKGLPASALKVLDEVYKKAKKENQVTQWLKVLIVKSEVVEQVQEDAGKKNLASIESEIVTAPPLVKQVLQSMAADAYWRYFQNHRWKFYNRTATIQFNKTDIDTWSVEDFHSQISRLYLASLQPAPSLQQCNISKFDDIIIKGNARNLRPTLFDLLAHKALSYFENDESSISKPIGAFELNDMAALAPAAIFVKYEYSSPDSGSHLLQAIKIYQSLVQFHRNGVPTDAWIDVDIARIEFANSKGSMPYKRQLYKEALEQIYYQHRHQPQAMQAGYLLAKWWEAKGNDYQPGIGNLEDKMALVEAIKIAREVKASFPKSEGGINAGNLLNTLEQSTLRITAENVNLINQPFRILTAFKNTSQVYFRLIKLTSKPASESDNLFNSNEYWWSYYTTQPYLAAWSQVLPKTDDAREHSAELKVDALPAGSYLLLASNSAHFNLNKDVMSSVQLAVSNLAMVNNERQVAILNRLSGEPIKGVNLQVWNHKYDYNLRERVWIEGKTYQSNTEGLLQLDENFTVEGTPSFLLSKDNDSLLIESINYYQYRSYNQPSNNFIINADSAAWAKQHSKYFIFTDRSLYRPGQTLFFKAIGITSNKKTGLPEVFLPDTLQQVILFDANSKQVATLHLKPNEFGSIAGKFILPTGGLTGQFRIEIIAGSSPSSQTVRVEEYKRPRFFVNIEPPAKSFKLNESVEVKGVATAYAGNAIDNASVKYRVYRQARMLYPWRGEGMRMIWPPMFNSNRAEIAFGEATTSSDGSFAINFPAIPDAGIDSKWQPNFNFIVEATVTDINGESHETTAVVSIGYRSLQLNLQKMNHTSSTPDSVQQFSISSSNLMGVAQPATVSWNLYQLKGSGRLLRSRYWPAPDTSVMNRPEFEQYFPNDPYEQEDDFKNWARGAMIQSGSVETSTQHNINIATASLAPGYYLLEAQTKDKDGNPVQAIEFLTHYHLKTGQEPAPSYLFEMSLKEEVQPGDAAIFLQGSTIANLPVLQQVSTHAAAQNSNNRLQWTRLNGLQSFRFPVSEQNRGGYTVKRLFVQNNRFYSMAWQVRVPWNNKQLKLTLETFRSKLLPGAQESWKLKISGNVNEKVSAELLASMYDASLDQIYMRPWPTIAPWPTYNNYDLWEGKNNFKSINGNVYQLPKDWKSYDKRYDQLLGESYGVELSYTMARSKRSLLAAPAAAMDARQGLVAEGSYDKISPDNAKKEISGTDNEGKPEHDAAPGTVQIRKNFNETAFFLPSLYTSDSGYIQLNFTMPEALTQWKLQLQAHTKSLELAQQSHTVITQKELMVQPNAPRFLRQGDKLELVTKVVNLGPEEKTGIVKLELLNALTLQPVDGWFQNLFPQQYFTAAPGQSVAVAFPMEVPVQFTNALLYRITAISGSHSDGEEMALPVLSNRMLVTESFPLNLRHTTSKVFEWKKLLESGNSPTLQHQSFTINYTSNPIWLAIKALPYLMEYPYDCSEQSWNRYYANALASKIVSSMPNVKSILEQWKGKDTAALLSPLQKNEALKQALLRETPWVLAAESITQQQQNLAMLFDVIHMQQAAEKTLSVFEKMQTPNGGFAWFSGGPDDRYMTQYIVTGMGHLKQLNAWPVKDSNRLQQIVNKAMKYLDNRMLEELKEAKKMKSYTISSLMVQYLYMRSCFDKMPLTQEYQTAYQYFFDAAKRDWLKTSKKMQGMIALVMHRKGKIAEANSIIKSLRENSITHEEFGMYWKEFNNPGFYWWQAPIESHALLLEAFAEIENNPTTIDDLKTWLLKQKQTTNWPSTKATAEACYALLMTGSDWVSVAPSVTIDAGGWKISNNEAEAGTGYFSQSQSGDFVEPQMGKIKVTVDNHGNAHAKSMSSWGAAYWQYFEDLDKITPAATPLSLHKTLMLQTMTNQGVKLIPITSQTPLKPGDKVTVRMEIRSDRNMEYVHLKDMRGACFEPIENLSGYRRQGGLGYYQAPTDASMNFFISYLPKGTYVFEYPLVITHEGNFNNGISTIQCMYEPAFSSHTAGQRVEVKNK